MGTTIQPFYAIDTCTKLSRNEFSLLWADFYLYQYVALILDQPLYFDTRFWKKMAKLGYIFEIREIRKFYSYIFNFDRLVMYKEYDFETIN